MCTNVTNGCCIFCKTTVSPLKRELPKRTDRARKQHSASVRSSRTLNSGYVDTWKNENSHHWGPLRAGAEVNSACTPAYPHNHPWREKAGGPRQKVTYPTLHTWWEETRLKLRSNSQAHELGQWFWKAGETRIIGRTFKRWIPTSPRIPFALILLTQNRLSHTHNKQVTKAPNWIKAAASDPDWVTNGVSMLKGVGQGRTNPNRRGVTVLRRHAPGLKEDTAHKYYIRVGKFACRGGNSNPETALWCPFSTSARRAPGTMELCLVGAQCPEHGRHPGHLQPLLTSCHERRPHPRLSCDNKNISRYCKKMCPRRPHLVRTIAFYVCEMWTNRKICSNDSRFSLSGWRKKLQIRKGETLESY